MEFTWSERKRSLNLKQHGLDFVDAPAVFGGLTFTFEDDRLSYNEQRFVTLARISPTAPSRGRRDRVVARRTDCLAAKA